VSFSNPFILIFRTFPRHVPCFPASVKIYFSSSFISVASWKMSPYYRVSSICLTIRSSIFFPGFLEHFSVGSFSSVRILSPVILTLLPHQFFFCLQGFLISIIYSLHCNHDNFLLEFIPQSIYIHIKFIFVIFLVS
jgi:hypothetical protein